jgi:hypothetical protein
LFPDFICVYIAVVGFVGTWEGKLGKDSRGRIESAEEGYLMEFNSSSLFFPSHHFIIPKQPNVAANGQ